MASQVERAVSLLLDQVTILIPKVHQLEQDRERHIKLIYELEQRCARLEETLNESK